MVAVVHVFMTVFAVPTPAAWYLGAIIYAGLVAVLFSKESIADKLAIYFMFVVVVVVGALTVCPCTGGHFIIAPLAGMMALGLVQAIRKVVARRSSTSHVTQQTPKSASESDFQ